MNRQGHRDLNQAAARLARAIRNGDSREVDRWQLVVSRLPKRSDPFADHQPIPHR